MKPTASMKGQLTMVALTERQARRLAEGITESHPSDYRVYDASDQSVAAAKARRVLEDRRIDATVNEDWFGL